LSFKHLILHKFEVCHQKKQSTKWKYIILGGFYIKQRQNSPILITKLEALLRRLPDNHPKRSKVEDKLASFSSGLKGERSLKYFYRYLPKDDIVFVYNTRILHLDYYFQLDTLIITSKFILLLEIKNYAGHLYFDDKYGQLVRTLNGKVDIFEDPILQVKRQSYHLSQIINKFKIPPIPIETLVVMTNPTAQIECSPSYKEALQKVIKSPLLQMKFENFCSKYKEAQFSQKQIKKTVRILNKLNDPYNPEVLMHYEINKNELITGVLCENCSLKVPLKRYKANWVCPHCKLIFKNAHIQALKDYALLISPANTNKECKKYLNLTSDYKTKYLLHSLNLKKTGFKKGTVYHLDSLII
jgi:hypothetical protein